MERTPAYDAIEPASRFQGIAFVGNYLPRNCGMATFMHDLAESVAGLARDRQRVIVAAVSDVPEGYSYPDRVKFEIRQDHRADYSRAADFLNFSRIDVVCLQHEYGIYGGEWGSNILTLVCDLNRPLVVTCHTVVKNAEPVQKEVFTELASRANRLVVMSEKARQFSEQIYGIEKERIVHIPHGIHDVPFIDPNYYKDRFGVEGRRVLLTFGLLHRNKGIEYMIEALPAVIERHPRTTYVILGATHPHVLRKEGEEYRLSLQRKVRELALEDHVIFHPRFVELEELLEYLGAADIVITPYVEAEQVTSGALCYAMGTGKAVVSTPYWHAEEMLADGRGALVPMRDPRALSEAVNSLLDDEVALSSMRKKAYAFTRNMTWGRVAARYIELFDEVRSHVPKVFPVVSSTRKPIAATNLPSPKLDHLFRLSDDTGIAHHARLTIPDWRYGYKLEDNAAALVVASKYHELFADEESAQLATIYLSLLELLIGDGRDPCDGMDYSRRKTGPASGVALGKTLWALGYTVSHGPKLLQGAANDAFQALMQNARVSGSRAIAYAVLGSANYLDRFPGASEVRRLLTRNMEELALACAESEWVEAWGAGDWPVAVQALAVASSCARSSEVSSLARDALKRMCRETGQGTVFLRRGINPDEEEIPAMAAAFVEALGAAFSLHRDEELLAPVRNAADWFLGVNRLSTPLYDFTTGGCHDAITASGLNRNQGTEATCYCLLAFLTLHELAGVEAGARRKERGDKRKVAPLPD